MGELTNASECCKECSEYTIYIDSTIPYNNCRILLLDSRVVELVV